MQDLLSTGAVRSKLSAETPSRRFLQRLVSQLQGLLNDPTRCRRVQLVQPQQQFRHAVVIAVQEGQRDAQGLRQHARHLHRELVRPQLMAAYPGAAA